MLPCRLLVDAPASGAWNMAVDETLLEWSAACGGLAWRFYRWQEPTLSLGYFQACEDRTAHAPSTSCKIIRRQSGGGAIVHDAELTYSVVLPASHPFATDRMRLYHAVHASLLDVLASWRIQGTLCERTDKPGLASAAVSVFPATIAGRSVDRHRQGCRKRTASLPRRRLAARERAGEPFLGCPRVAGNRGGVGDVC